MHCSCVRQTELPHTSRLFADAVYHADRVARFYRHPAQDLDAYRAAAREADLPADRRAALVALLRKRNGDSPSLERLAQPGTVAVVTGQQVGLFGGPAYTIYKALTAVRLASYLNENGIPASPVFWLATEDHDFDEVNQAWVFDAQHRPSKLQLARGSNGQPVGDVPLIEPPEIQLRSLLHGMPFGEEVADLAEETYRPGCTLGHAFGEMLQALLKTHGILQIDPMMPEFRALAAPLMRRALDQAPELGTRLLERNKELTAEGYHAQVHVEEHTSLVFLLENGKRLALRRQGREYVINGRRLSTEEMMDRAESLSPNALLRPVVQDSVLPTVAYVGGPAEIAYLAQSNVIYQDLLGRQPVAVPRAGFTLLDARSDKLITRYGLKLPDFFHGEDVLRERMAQRLVPPALTHALRDSTVAVEETIERLRREVAAFDPTLGVALDRSARKVRYQFEKIGRKAGREALQREARAGADAEYLNGLIFPGKHLQERLYSILPFVAKHGFDLIDRIYEQVRLDCPDHRVLVV